jgi:hypothetical protein
MARIIVGTNCRQVRILVTPVFTSVTIFVTIVHARVLIKGKRVKIEVTRIRTNDNNQRREYVPRKYTIVLYKALVVVLEPRALTWSEMLARIDFAHLVLGISILLNADHATSHVLSS